MNTIGILEEIKRLYSILEESDGDVDIIDPNDLESLAQYEKDLKNKVFGLIQARKDITFRIANCESYIEKYEASIKSLKNKSKNIDDLIKIVVSAYGTVNKTGNKVMEVYEHKISVVEQDKYFYDDATVDKIANLVVKDSTVVDDDKYLDSVFKFSVNGLSIDVAKKIIKDNPTLVLKPTLDKTVAKEKYDSFKSVTLFEQDKDVIYKSSHIDSIVSIEKYQKLTIK